jgi:regulator of nucleoside diphosphate kinase
MSYADVELPPITITTEDMRYLSVLGLSSAPSAEFLAREVDRAKIVPVHQALPGLVRMGSLVKYLNNTTGEVRELSLVRAGDADGEVNQVSVLSPVGAALIGLSVGQSIEFKTAKNEKHSLTILRVQD